MAATPCFVGIDVAKAQLDMALRPTGERWAVAHEDTGIAALVARLQAVPPTLMVLEATGGYQRAVVAALAAAGLPVAVVNPRQARDFAKATGPLATTDALDARALAPFAEAPRPAGPAAATRRQADRGTAPPRECAPAAPDGHSGPYHRAQHPPGGARR